ncbi:MAG: serine/threonine-protein kinase [Pirellulales bacterium]
MTAQMRNGECGMGVESRRGDTLALTTDHRPLTTANDDPRVIAAVEEYLRLCEAGSPPEVEAFVAERAEIAPLLRQCLGGLEFVQAAVPEIEASADGLDRLALAESLVGQPLGDFRIIREIGRGGMGVVYEAEQISLARRVALKILPFAAVLDPRHLQRFKNEALAAAHLDHPNIVEVYGVGCERGVHFYAMRYVEGQTLAAVIDALRLADAGTAGLAVGGTPTLECDDSSSLSFSNSVRLPNDANEIQSCDKSQHSKETLAAALSTLRETKPRDFFRTIAELGIQAAEALDHAHQMGVVHRDIKPSNLILEGSPLDRSHLALRDTAPPSPLGRGQGEGNSELRAPHSKLWITDFGLAHIDSGGSLTMTGDLVGTLRYMSPEQAEGKSAILDHRTDIYSLGITLYELLTLRAAFPASDRQTLIRQIVSEEPAPPRRLNTSIPSDLETIILKAIAKEPVERYASARELAADLKRFLTSEPIRARRAMPWQRFTRWSRRHRELVAGCAVLLAVAAVLATVAAARLAIERDQTITALDEAKRQRQLAVAAQERAETGQALARTAVDDMYTRVASVWLAKETAPSGIQIDLMRRALAAYERLADLPATDAASRRSAAIALARVGEIKHFLGEKREAAGALQKSIALLNVDKDDATAREETLAALAMSHRKLSQVQLALAEWDNAEKSYAAGYGYVQSLVNHADARPEHRFELALFRMLGAELAIRGGRLEEAETLARTAFEELTALEKIQGVGNLRGDLALDWQWAGLRAGLLSIDVMRRLGRLTEAEKEAKQMLAAINRAQWGPLYDARELIQVEAEVHDQLASVKIALGQPEAAIVHLRETLRLKQQNLRAKQRPFLFWVESFLGKRGAEEGNEAVPFCSFAETQLRLAILLQTVGRPYEAELHLGELVQTAFFLCAESGHDLRYMLLYGKAWSAAADFVAAARPQEEDALRMAADTVWRAVAVYFPQAVEHPDLTPQARKTISAHIRDGAGQLPAEKVDLYKNMPTPAWKTELIQRTLLSSQPAGWDSEAGGKIRVGGRVDDCLHIAMAHHRLGNQEEARVWLDYATKMMGDNPHIEVVELREEAQALLRSQSKTEESTTEANKP